MTGSTLPAAVPSGPATVEAAEAAWLAGLVADTQDGLRALLHPGAVIVHGAPGLISTSAEFLAFATRVGRISEVTVHAVTVQRLEGVTIVSCLQESRIAFTPELTPFVIQAAVSRTWLPGADGWRLVHLQMARRQPPG